MLIPFQSWHMEDLPLTDRVRAHLGAGSRTALESLAARNLAYTIIAESGAGSVRVVGVAGALPLADATVAEVFVIAAADCSMWRVEFAKSVRQILDHARKHFARIEAVADAGVSARWFEFLGFKPVGESAPDRWAMEGKT